MPVTYTITAGDVNGVTPSSRLTEGVTFDWTNQKVFIPDTVGSVTSQFIVDNARFAEETIAGKARRQIVEGAGKTQIGSDPDSGLPIFTPTVAIFRDNWKIVTQKTTGDFVVRDVYSDSGSITNIPYDAVAGVFIQYLTSVTGAVSQVNTGGGGGGGASAAEIWTYGDRSLTGPQAVNSAATLGLIQAFVQGRFRISYSLGKAYQYGTDGTVLQEFNLRDADGNMAINAQTAVDRVPVGGTVAPIGLSLSLSDLEDVNLDNPVDGSIPIWNNGELDLSPAVVRGSIIGGGSF